jgi:MerR family transcriptional regulator/heat shock protein HspR
MTDEESKTYSLPEACQTLGVSAGDITTYLKEGLVAAERDAGGDVRFSRVQMRRLWSIVSLQRDLGINLPGVEAVLRLREQYERIRGDLAMLVEIVERELGDDVWNRLWPKDRPRPGVEINVEGMQDLPDTDAGPEAGPKTPPRGSS